MKLYEYSSIYAHYSIAFVTNTLTGEPADISINIKVDVTQLCFAIPIELYVTCLKILIYSC